MPTSPTLFLDTQVLIYAFEQRQRLWVEFIESRLSSGYRLVMSEEILYEFGQSGTLEAALNLTDRTIERAPLWVRSFAELESDEVCHFARALIGGTPTEPLTVFLETFSEVSQLAGRRRVSPNEFVRFAFDPKAREELGELAKRHAKVVDALSRAVSSGQLTKELNEQALQTGLRTRLARGSALTVPLMGYELDTAVKLCFKHHKRLIRECHAYATEYHLANYRTSTPKRVARISDSKDLMLATAAFPYVSAFVTNDGYLHDALSYVKKRLPHIQTELIRTPAGNNAA